MLKTHDRPGSTSESEQVAPPKRGMTAAKAFLICTPVTILLLTVTSVKLAMMEDKPDKPAVVEIRYQDVLDVAYGNYQKAKSTFERAAKLPLADPNAIPRLSEAKDFLQKEDRNPATIKTIPDAVAAGRKGELGAQQLIDWVRTKVEDPASPGPGETPRDYDFERRLTEVNMLLITIRKEIEARK